jgi:hypothetical protein
MVTPKGSISIGRESLQVFLCTRRLGILAGFTARGQSWWNMAWTGNKKAFCVLEFTKTESIVTVQWWFRTTYHTEPPTNKTIREWYMKFQYSDYLGAAKRTGQPRPACSLHHHNWLSFGKFQDTKRFLVPCPRHVSSWLPPSGETCKYTTASTTQQIWEILYLLICSPSTRPSRLQYRRGRKTRRDLWITLHVVVRYTALTD